MPLSPTLSKLVRVPTRDQVYRRLREWIVTGALQPGERLNYHELGQQLGVSFIPLREACLRLHHEGFVEMAHSRWTQVAPVDAGQAAQLCLAIEALEVLTLELAAPSLQPKDIRQLRVLNETLRGALESGDALEAATADEAFHGVWTQRSAGGEIAELLSHLKARLQVAEGALFAGEVHTAAAVAEHDALIERLAEQQNAEALGLLRGHWRARFDRLQAEIHSKTDAPVTV